MPIEIEKPRCSKCNRELESPEQRTPCPDCGSTNRTIFISLSENISVRTGMKSKTREAGKKEPIAEQKSGDDIQKSTGRWVTRAYVVDRKNDRYYEIVKDTETGVVLHEVSEPLSVHRGHGSARLKKPKKE